MAGLLEQAGLFEKVPEAAARATDAGDMGAAVINTCLCARTRRD